MDGWTDRWTNIQINQCRCVSFAWHLWQVPAVWGSSCRSPPRPQALGACSVAGREVASARVAYLQLQAICIMLSCSGRRH